jgi:uncharacterized phage-associated protein
VLLTHGEKKLRDAVAYVVHAYAARHEAPLTRTKLVKYVYLTDELSSREHRASLTGVVYRSYHYGPYSSEIVTAAESQPGYIVLERGTRADGAGYYAYRPARRAPRFSTLSRQDRATLDEVLDRYGAKSLKQLLRIVYATRAFRNAAKGDQISFA